MECHISLCTLISSVTNESTCWISPEQYSKRIEESRHQILIDLKLAIEIRFVKPMTTWLHSLKNVRARITKREHKRIDYDRHRLTLQDIEYDKNHGPERERKLIKQEQVLLVATQEYDKYNNQLKNELPRLLSLRFKILDPCIKSLYLCQRKMFQVLLEMYKDIPNSSVMFKQVIEQFKSDQMPAVKALQKLSLIHYDTVNTNDKDFNSTLVIQQSEKLYPNTMSLKSISDALPSTSNNVVAMFAFEAQESSDLSFKAGDVIEVLQRTQNKNDWWNGRLNGQVGDFPANYVKEMDL